MIQVDIGGHPPIPLGAPPFSLSVFHFRHNLLFLAVFQVLNFWSRFEALNDVFLENGEQHGSIDQYFSFKSCTPRTDISNELSSASNGDQMPKLHLRELNHQFTQTGPTVLALHILRLRFWMFQILHCFNNK